MATLTDRDPAVVDEAGRIENPAQDDIVVFLETSEESGGERTLLEMDVAPGGKVLPHRHHGYAESFRVLDGRLGVRVGDADLTLDVGDAATVPPGTLHAWRNDGPERTVALVEMRPGQPGFEKTLRVAYGLAADGRTDRQGRPRNPLHLALLLEWGDMSLPGAFALVAPVLRALAAVARRVGVAAELERRYT